MKDDRLRNPNFNPTDDPSKDNMATVIWTEDTAHLRITLYDRLLASAVSGLSAHARHGLDEEGVRMIAFDGHDIAIAALERRAMAFGIKVKGGA